MGLYKNEFVLQYNAQAIRCLHGMRISRSILTNAQASYWCNTMCIIAIRPSVIGCWCKAKNHRHDLYSHRHGFDFGKLLLHVYYVYLRCLVNVMVNHRSGVPLGVSHTANPGSFLIQSHLHSHAPVFEHKLLKICFTNKSKQSRSMLSLQVSCKHEYEVTAGAMQLFIRTLHCPHAHLQSQTHSGVPSLLQLISHSEPSRSCADDSDATVLGKRRICRPCALLGWRFCVSSMGRKVVHECTESHNCSSMSGRVCSATKFAAVKLYEHQPRLSCTIAVRRAYARYHILQADPVHNKMFPGNVMRTRVACLAMWTVLALSGVYPVP